VPPSHRRRQRGKLVSVRHSGVYVRFLTGVHSQIPDLGTIRHMLAGFSGRRVVIADWVTRREQLGLMLTTAEGVAPIVWISGGMERLQELAARWSSSARMRASLLSGAYDLEALSLLIAPLAGMTAPGDHIVLCPPGSMQTAPLHALNIDGMPLAARNCISYAPSAAVLRILHARQKLPPAKDHVFTDPRQDRAESRRIGAAIGGVLNVTPAAGDAVTRQACIDALKTARIFHFQGHALFDGNDPLRSRLLLAQGAQLSARDILELPEGIGARLAVLGACASGRVQMAPGDEPMGLPAALLAAGAGAVCAPLWPVDAGDAAAFMEAFYGHLNQSRGALNLAEALQAAASELRSQARYSAPYSWAPYVLYGDWAALSVR
jgi:hypothetical protein